MRYLIGLLICLVIPAYANATVGNPSYLMDATSTLDPYAPGKPETGKGQKCGPPSCLEWYQQHVSLVKGYGTFAKEHYVNNGLPTIDYHDPSTEGYAPLTPEKRKSYMKKVEKDKADGFLGVHNDDINFSLSYRDGSQNKSSYEPEAKELGLLIEEERNYWPEAIIETNTQWHDISGKLTEVNVERMINNSTQIYKEFGVGPTAGITTKADYKALLSFVDSLHSAGKGITFGGDYNANTVKAMEYTLATELLDNQVPDHYSTCCKYATPPEWWTGSDVNLGVLLEALPTRLQNAHGNYLRFYGKVTEEHNGMVLVVPPGGTEETWTWVSPAYKSTYYGSNLHSITLKPSEGAVLVAE